MNIKLSLLGSVLVASSFALVGCDSATATNDKQADAKKALVEKTDAVKKTAKDMTVSAKDTSEKVVEVAKDTSEKAVEAAKDASKKVAEAAKDVNKSVAKSAEKAKEVVSGSTTAAAVASTEKPQAQAVENTSEFVEGKHYFEIFPTMQTDTVGGKIEVVELMWLGCPHCYDLEPTMKKYKKSLPDYVDFKQVPAMLNPRWTADAKMFYIAEILDPKGEKKLIDKIFHSLHVQKRRKMSKPDNLRNYMLQLGITADQYDNAVNSMVLSTKLNRAKQISADSQAQSVPSVIVNGKYRTSPYAAGGNKELIQIVEMLTKRELGK